MSEVKRLGTRVEITTESEDTARMIEASARNEVLNSEGGLLDRIENWYKNADRFAAMQPAFELISWLLLVLGATLEFSSWSSLLPGKGISVVLGLIGVAILVATKFSFARWARAVNEGKLKRQKMYGITSIVGLLVCSFMAIQFTASQASNEQAGASNIRAEIELKEQELLDLRRTQRNFESAGVSSLPVEAIQFEIDALLNETATNSAGISTGKSVAEWVGDCTGSSYYVETYCAGIISWKRKLVTRAPYEETVAKIETVRQDIETLRSNMPQQSGITALGAQFADGDDFFKSTLPGFFFVFMIVTAMGGFTFLSKWDSPEDE